MARPLTRDRKRKTNASKGFQSHSRKGKFKSLRKVYAPVKKNRQARFTADRVQITKVQKLVPQGSVALQSVITPIHGGKPEVVTYSSGTLADVVGSYVAKKIQRQTLSLVKELKRKRLALAVVPLDEDEIEELVGQIEQPKENGNAWDPHEEGRKAIEALKEAEGGWIDREEAAGRLDLSLAQLYNRIHQRKLVAWVDGSGRYRFPKWQFGANGMLDGVVDCLQILGESDPWAVMRFFLTPSASAGDKTPLELLRAGQIEEAKEIAEAQTAIHG